MKIGEIIEAAASAYPDGCVLEYWDKEKVRPKRNIYAGDGLAEFIAFELNDVYKWDPDRKDADQIKAAVHAMDTAIADLQKVADAIRALGVKQ